MVQDIFHDVKRTSSEEMSRFFWGGGVLKILKILKTQHHLQPKKYKSGILKNIQNSAWDLPRRRTFGVKMAWNLGEDVFFSARLLYLLLLRPGDKG